MSAISFPISAPWFTLDIQNWKCVKRDGEVVPFDENKIKAAITKCLRNQNVAIPNSEQIVIKTTYAVLRGLNFLDKTEFSVEEIQQRVVTALYAQELYFVAESYLEYKKARERLRKAKGVSSQVRESFRRMRETFKTDLQAYQFMSKFSRWLPNENRRESWPEAVYRRVIPWFKNIVAREGKELPEQTWEWLGNHLYNLSATPAMRVLQMAGPALERCEVGVFNCAYLPIDSVQAFGEFLYILMQGTGCGFSVETKNINKLPEVQPLNGETKHIIVEDTTESWCDAVVWGLNYRFSGYRVTFDTSAIRPKGARLKTKGGFASGPQPFIDLNNFIDNIFEKRRNETKEGVIRLRDTDVHRICCFIARIVEVGGVRRAATISLSDLESEGMRKIKPLNFWSWSEECCWDDGSYLAAANNSAVYEKRPSLFTFAEEWKALIASYSGERGIFNREAAKKCAPSRRYTYDIDFGVNPCAEIILRPKQFCNLTIAVAREEDTEESLKDKLHAAVLFGIIQTLCTRYRYLSPEWRENVEAERLLGVDITGHADCPLLRWTKDPVKRQERFLLLERLKKYVLEKTKYYADYFGINMPTAVTTVKPSGDSAVLMNCASGISPRFSIYQIRRCRESKYTPVGRFLAQSGVPYVDLEKSGQYAFEFPLKAPEGSTCRNEMTAIEQFYNWLDWKQAWAEHSVSTTIYVDEHEWYDLGQVVYDHIDYITGVSFLPKDNGTYKRSMGVPNEEISEQEYLQRVAEFPEIDWSKLTYYEDTDETTVTGQFACVAGSCEVV